MIVNLGDSYSLNCFVKDNLPHVKIVGECYLVNYCSSNNECRSYINDGSFKYSFVDRSSNIDFVNHVIEYLNDNEVLVVLASSKELIYILYDLSTGEVGYKLD